MSVRAPPRTLTATNSTLETVQEYSLPGTPAKGLDGTQQVPPHIGLQQAAEQTNVMDQAFARSMEKKESTSAHESGSDSGGNKSEAKIRAASVAVTSSVAPTPVLNTTKSFSTGTTTVVRAKAPGEGSAKNMTVETETVSSIPQVAVGGGAGAGGGSGTLRAKPSSETIRPKKEKKKTARKAPSITSGTGEPSTSFKRSYYHHHHLHHHVHSHSGKTVSELHYMDSTTRPDTASSSVCSMHSFSGAGSPRQPSDHRRSSLSVYNVSALLTRYPRPASSKADIFEAKIASAVDQADSSDSEETFVYESNPPDKNNQPRRFHSRTPSATSMTSQAEHNRNSRSIHGVMDAFQGVSMKKSMKFTNTHNSNTPDHGTEDDGKGTVRSHVGTGRGTTHHHHIGRWGRQNGAGGNGHPSLFDNESPFPNATRQSKAVNTSRNSSRPHSPRFAHNKTPNGKRDALLSSGYDDDGTRADDERAPLLSSTVRSNRRRRQPLTMRQLEHQDSMQHKSFLGRFAGCLVLSVMILLIASGGLGLWLATTQPLTGIEVKGLKNIIATEQELMVDMQVLGRNPNIVAVTVESIDVEIFAKSKHAGTDSEYWKRPTQDDIRPYDDDPRDPPHYDDPSSTATMRLGNVSAFFSPLTFDPSPLSYKPTLTTGQIRLARPGNSSADGGSERWERILKYEFELVVNGVLKYQLPLSQRIRRVEVVARQRVEPDREGVVPPDEGGEGQGVHIAMD
jgi:hypothetical protein